MEANIGQRLFLERITRRGKQLIRMHGDIWKILRISETVSFSDKEGPWLYIKPIVDIEDNNVNARWMHKTQDKNLIIVGFINE